MSDIHGQYPRYKAMLEKIDLKDEDKLYVLGDAIDRGPGSIEILFDIMERKNCELFLGNLEHMMLTYLEGSDRQSWFFGVNGGKVTFERLMALDKESRDRIIDYLLDQTTIKKDLLFPERRIVLSHTSALNDGIDMYTRDFKDHLMYVQDIVWDMSASNIASIKHFPKTEKKTFFISGHVITRRLHDSDEIYFEEYDNNYTWIDIDCGCAMGSEYGNLACLKVSDEGEILEVLYAH